MVTDEMVEKASVAMCLKGGFDPFEAMPNDGPRWKYYVDGARAALEAALSAAEPVACEYGHDNGDGTYSPTYARWPLPPHIKPHGDMPVNLFYAAPPAPSVAVKELPYHCDVCTVPGYGDAPCSPLCDRPALSAQVQDVAGWQLVGEVVPYRGALSSLTNGRDLKLNTHVSHLEIGTKLYAAAPAKQEGGHD